MTAWELSVRNLNVRAGETRILREVGFDLPPRSFVALMGPMGSGKSTFIKFLADELGGEGLEAVADRADYRGAALWAANRPVHIRQRVRERATSEADSRRLLQDRLAEMEAVAGHTDAVLCIDEPTAGLEQADGAAIMAALRERSAVGSVLMVTHNLGEVYTFCDRVALFGAGRLLAHEEVGAFFAAAPGSHAERFVRTGGLDLPQADTPQIHLSAEHRTIPEGFNPEPAAEDTPEPVWIIDGQLALREGINGDRGRNGFDATVTVGLRGALFRVGAEEALRIDWPEARDRPDRSVALVLDLAERLDGLLRAGRRVLLITAENLPGTAALLGAFLVLRGFPPDAAATLAAAKLPQLFFGMRLEELYWNVELEIATRH